ncbi:hypothetical protein H5410_012736 [Solanum commersonii]|uniref:Uncharacterized protein n=1 Tax=Solanum commersonii TaxID=4109 RepID=A0A9J6ASI3_SOLCO|nr:hypothetical protein H5410_012736 [Solanum commersonii]
MKPSLEGVRHKKSDAAAEQVVLDFGDDYGFWENYQRLEVKDDYGFWENYLCLEEEVASRAWTKWKL